MRGSRKLSALLVWTIGVSTAAFPASAEIKTNPAILPPGSLELNPAYKDLLTFQNSADVQLKWKATTVAADFSGAPAIGPDGTMYIGYTFVYILSAQYFVTAFRPDGTKLWTTELEAPILTPPIVGPDGTVYAGTGYRDEAGELVAIRPDGTKKWSFAAGAHIATAPVFGTDGTVYAASEDGILHALNPQDGTEQWLYDLEQKSKARLTIGPDDTIYAANGTNALHAIKPNGTRKWDATTGGPVNTPSAISPDGTIYAGADDHKLYALSPTGTLKWALDLGSPVYAPAVGGSGVYVGTQDGILHAVQPNGGQQWQFALGGSDHPPVIGPNGLIYVQAATGHKGIYALGPDGQIRWKYKIETADPLPFALGPDGTLYDVSTKYPDPKSINLDDLEHTWVTYIYALKVPVSVLSLNQTALDLAVGQSGKLTPSITPSYASDLLIKWKSSNPNIATVDDQGQVTAMIPGTVIITATADGRSAQTKVTVAERTTPITAVSSVALNKTALFLRAGESETLLAKIIPDNASNPLVTWKSGDASVAAVSANGKVTAVSAGKTDVTVTTQDGKFAARSKVIVTASSADPAANTSPFTDISGHWAAPEIVAAYERSIANGYPDFTFRPDAGITRSEFTVLLMNGLKPAITGAELPFSDAGLIEDWAAASVRQAVQLGIISGYPDGSFRPAANITHAEMMSMVVKGVGLPAAAGALSDYADDTEIPEWAKPAAAVAGANNLLGGTVGNRFAPSSLATRAEAVAAIVRLLDVKP